MEWQEGKDKFLQSWGTLGTSWGINRTMAQIHALMMISPNALSADEVMEELQISRGNANMNIRALMDWGLVYKELREICRSSITSSALKALGEIIMRA